MSYFFSGKLNEVKLETKKTDFFLKIQILVGSFCMDLLHNWCLCKSQILLNLISIWIQFFRGFGIVDCMLCHAFAQLSCLNPTKFFPSSVLTQTEYKFLNKLASSPKLSQSKEDEAHVDQEEERSFTNLCSALCTASHGSREFREPLTLETWRQDQRNMDEFACLRILCP